MEYIVYTKDGCKYCTLAKKLLDEKHIGYVEIIIGEDITRDSFKTAYPNIKTVPFIKNGHHVIGGYEELVESLS